MYHKVFQRVKRFGCECTGWLRAGFNFSIVTRGLDVPDPLAGPLAGHATVLIYPRRWRGTLHTTAYFTGGNFRAVNLQAVIRSRRGASSDRRI